MMSIAPLKCPHDGAICHHMCPETMGINPDDSIICYREREGMSLTQGIEDHPKATSHTRPTCPLDNSPCLHRCMDNVPPGPLTQICRRAIDALTLGTPSPWNDLSPDAPTIENAQGGKQSYLAARLDLLDPDTILRLGAILGAGAEKYGESNWRRIDSRDHVNHALVHLMGWLAGDQQDDHLGHALCRLMMACAMEK